jgi:hypothetical protein
MTEVFFIGIYWQARTEGIDSCSNKLLELFNFLKQEDESFNFWYKTQKPKKGQVIEPIDSNTKIGVKNLLALSQNYNDDGTLHEDLGYTIFLKSRTEFAKAHTLSLTCDCRNKSISNCVTINIAQVNAPDYLDKITNMEKIYTELVKIWHPDRGLIRRGDVLIFSQSYV